MKYFFKIFNSFPYVNGRDLNFSKSSAEFNTSISKSADETTLGERLKLLDGDFDPIPTQLLRKVF